MNNMLLKKTQVALLITLITIPFILYKSSVQAADLQPSTIQPSQVVDKNSKNLPYEKKHIKLDQLQDHINKINIKQTEHLTININKIQTILDTMKSRINNLQQYRTDTASLSAKLDQISDTLIQTKTDISSQSAKQYIINRTDPHNIKNQAQQTIQQLKQVLEKLQFSVKDLKQQTLMVAREVIQLEKMIKKGGNNGTPTPTQ